MFSGLKALLSARPVARSSREFNHAGLAALDAGALDQALAAFGAALALEPDSADILTNIATAHLSAGQPQAAAEALERALRAAPAHPAAHCNYGMLLAQAGACDAAAGHLRQVPRGHSAIRAADINLTNALLHACDWDALQAHVGARVAARARDPDWWMSIEPYQAVLLGLAPELARAVADAHAARLRMPADSAITAARTRTAGRAGRLRPRLRPRLRVGYLSSDFRRHATMDLLLETLEAHDRDRCEIMLYSYGPDDGSGERARAVAAADRFTDVAALSHVDAARVIARDAIDVLIDLKGHTGEGRPQIVARRPAPVIVNYLGYPGTLGGTLADWFFGDAVATPTGCEAHFSEQVLRLAPGYQANGAWHAPSPPPSRASLALPDTGVVFCCFNSLYKVGREVFAAWMEILRAAPGSVLWLLAGNADASTRLRQAAQAAAVDSNRLVFAAPAPVAEHLARMGAADVFLDTWPVSAHTLASDAMRAGLPLVTLAGVAFASRVAASVLGVVGLPDLACADADRYVRTAVALARDAGLRAVLRQRLATGRPRLFDPRGHARNLEQAYALVDEKARTPAIRM